MSETLLSPDAMARLGAAPECNNREDALPPKQVAEPSAAEITETADTTEALPEWAQDPKAAVDYVKQLREENAKYRTRAKEFADDTTYERAQQALAKLEEIENANKSELDIVNDKLAKASADAATARQELLRERYGRKFGLPDDIMEFLTGDSEAEVEEKAERLSRYVKSQEPRADRSQGMIDNKAEPSAKDDFIQNTFSF